MHWKSTTHIHMSLLGSDTVTNLSNDIIVKAFWNLK